MRCDGKPVRPGTRTPHRMSKAESLRCRMGPGLRTPSGPAVLPRLQQQAEDKTASDPSRNSKSSLATREPSRQDIHGPPYADDMCSCHAMSANSFMSIERCEPLLNANNAIAIASMVLVMLAAACAKVEPLTEDLNRIEAARTELRLEYERADRRQSEILDGIGSSNQALLNEVELSSSPSGHCSCCGICPSKG